MLQTNKVLTIKINGVDTSPLLLEQKQRTDQLKAEKIKAKQLLETATINSRTENLKLREQKAQQALERLALKQLIQAKKEAIELEIQDRMDFLESDNDPVPTPSKH